MKKIGREVLFIEAKDNNLRNGEGSFIRLKNNAILFGYTEYFGDDWEDDATARIYEKRGFRAPHRTSDELV